MLIFFSVKKSKTEIRKRPTKPWYHVKYHGTSDHDEGNIATVIPDRELNVKPEGTSDDGKCTGSHLDWKDLKFLNVGSDRDRGRTYEQLTG